MASRLDPIAKTPPWQLALIWVLVAALIVVGWWFLFYTDALAQRGAQETALRAAQAELADMETKRKNNQQQIEEQLAAEQAEKAKLSKLPLTNAAVSNLMRKFQQNGRLVGVEIKQWTPEPEQMFDGYAKLPIKVRATGTWHQFGELFRMATEMDPQVNIEALNVRITDAGRSESEGGFRTLEATFTASTFRFVAQTSAAPPPGGAP